MNNDKNLRIKYKNRSLGFFIFFLISMTLFVYGLRGNYQKMVNLRNTLYSVDKNNGDVGAALNNLRIFVTSHINTNLNSGNTSVYPPIQLQYTYQRLVQSQLQSQNLNTQIYTNAEDYCQAQVPNGFSGRYRIPCVENYIDSHSLTKISVDPSLYEFSFISPTFSFDFAGYTMLLTIFFGVITFIYLILYLTTK